MQKVRVFLVLLSVAICGVAAAGTTASAATVSAVPMKVKVTPFAGKKVRVAKKLKVVVSCTKDCTAKVRITLVTPAGNSTVKGGRNLEAGRGWITGMVLTSYGTRMLKNHYRRSRLKVAVTARNRKHGTIRKKTRSFRFRR